MPSYRLPSTGRTLKNFSDFSSSYQGGLNLEWLRDVGRLGEKILFRLGRDGFGGTSKPLQLL